MRPVTRRFLPVAISAAISSLAAPAYSDSTTRLDAVQIIGSQENVTTSGSAHVISEEQLEKNEYTDVHRVLRQVPGVYFREEDGYGLRPNIGIRGSGSGRASKVSLMEDGVLIAPAPYGDPAAYYFPTTARMSSIEVLKGPDTLRYGPFTVGGAVNMISSPIPDSASGMVNAEVGEEGEQRLHVRYGNSGEQFGYLLETHQHETDGFKKIDNSDRQTGFDKSDYLVKLRWRSPVDAPLQQQVDLKLQRDTEVSDETYLGLTDFDFKRDENRRYALSEMDQMSTEHEGAVLRHQLFFGDYSSITTTLYHNEFARDWFKTDRVNGTSISALIGQANTGNANAFGILQGNNVNNVDVKHNSREYFSKGAQVELNTFAEFLGGQHDIVIGARGHRDEVDRFQPVERYNQVNGRLAYQTTLAPGAGDNRIADARATSLWLVDQIQAGENWLFTGSVRYEDVDTRERRWNDVTRTQLNQISKNSQSEVLGGFGATYLINDNWSVIAGVHDGFAPAGAGSVKGTEPEMSNNYEAGFRFRSERVAAEVIGFYSDYTNAIQNCSIANPCGAQTAGTQQAGKNVIKGVEALASVVLWQNGDISVPLRTVYTYTRGDVTKNADTLAVLRGDPIAYLPKHLASASIGVEHKAGWSAQLNASYTDDMCINQTCGRPGVIDTFLRTDEYVVVDAVVSRMLTQEVEAYAKIDNLLNEQAIVSRSPAGARPNKPRTAYAGIKVNF